MQRAPGYFLRFAMLLVCLAVPAYLAAANYAYFEQYLTPLRYFKSKVEIINDHVMVGPYADEADLMALKGAGVTTVVSLLDPAVVYERSMLAQETQAAKKVGVRFISLPMHRNAPPGSLSNRLTERLLARALNGLTQEKFYVHGFFDAPRSLVIDKLSLKPKQPSSPKPLS